MGVLLVVLLLALLLGGLGFAVHVLWIVAVVVFAVWLAGFVVGHAGRRTAASGSRGWYRW